MPENSHADCWVRLFRRRTLEGALQELAGWLDDPAGIELGIEISGQPSEGRILYQEGGSVPADTPILLRSVTVSGRPEWRLTASRLRGTPPEPVEMERIASGLAAWRSARVEISRIEVRLTHQNREIETHHALARRAAEARDPLSLFQSAFHVLDRGGLLDLAIVVHGIEGHKAAEAFTTRPVAGASLQDLSRRGIAELTGEPPPPGEVDLRLHPLPAFDGGPQPGDDPAPERAMLLPILRRGRPVAIAVVVPTESGGERSRRLCRVAANELSLHLDRILTLQEAEQGRFGSILDSMPQAVFLTDRRLRILLANRAAEGLLSRLEPRESPDHLERVGDLDVRRLAAAVLEEGLSSAAGEARLKQATRWSVSLAPIVTPEAGNEGLVIVLADVTEERRLFDQLAQAEKLTSLGRMISGVAHELNNPLSSVLGYADLARSTIQDPGQSKRLEIILREARRCQKIVQNLLRFARRAAPERKPLSINEVVESVVALVGYALRADGIVFEVELDRSIPPISGDAHLLQQAVLNLVTNAHHAVKGAGGGRVRIATTSPREGWVRVLVEDDGPGVPEDLRSKIFDPFFTTKPAGEGTGLGLSLVYGTVTSHGGRVDLDSGRARGATFLVDLPVGAAAESTVASVTSPAQASSSGVSARILVVDDEEAVRLMICEALAAEGHLAVGATDGLDAVARLRDGSFDLVVSDLRMPGMDAEELQLEMERLDPGSSKRLLFTTGDTVARDLDALVQRSGIPVLRKPFELSELRRAVWARLSPTRGVLPEDD